MSDPYICIAKMSDLSAARVAAARLESEGVMTRIHGEALGPFPVTVGRLAVTELWVPSADMGTAAIVLEDLGIECEPQP